MAEPKARQRTRLRVGAFTLAAAFALVVEAGPARPSAPIMLTMLANVNKQPAYDVLIPNFERVYPNIKIDITYAPANTGSQVQSVELAGGNAPDLLLTQPGSGSVNSIAVLAKAGDLAPMIKSPWVKWSLPSVISADKYGQGLFAFTPGNAPYGVFTNDDLFKKLGLKVPRTFAQLLDVCQKAKAAGTVALLIPGGTSTLLNYLPNNVALATVYGKDKRWASEQRAGTVTFESSIGWHQAMQELVDMNNAGCYEAGASGTTQAAALAQFAQGQALMFSSITGNQGLIAAAGPRFKYSHHPFPIGGDPSQTLVLVSPGDSVSVNAHSSADKQAAAQTFIDFIARPKQDALYAQTTGFVTQYQFLKQQFPAFMSGDEAAALSQGRYALNPGWFWWNANVLLALQQNVVGLLTGQQTIDGVLNAMDVAWKQGPA
jgi:raffinose/stachyose/melibiose transport system substrate-binding protein